MNAPQARPSVCVVIPTRDRPRLLAQAVRSVLDQEGVAVEVVVVDDGSAAPPGVDPAVAVVRHQTSRGVAAARNAGTVATRAPWVAWLDDDDIYAPDRLGALVLGAERCGAEFAYSSAVIVDGDLNPLRIDEAPSARALPGRLRFGNAIPAGGSNVVARRSLIERCGGFDEGLSFAADWDMWIRFATAAKGYSVPRPLIAYRQHEAGWTSLGDAGLQRDLDRVAVRHPSTTAPSAARMVARSLWWNGETVAASRKLLAMSRGIRKPRDLRYALAFLVPRRLVQRIGLVASVDESPDWLEVLRKHGGHTE